ncbi:twin-arginine translocation signal domain-containing protein [Psychrosphaera algicola]|uniref:Twin-arginine translocation signal domain-containing protein n=1 Tax=Psychrosphaera algicola TaxID=3023714 RepID=A0ABT5FJ90_9GAMM|nr:twin-arginine translocation signal domain-containing protein [Psychrosphaera sp. G1-22]MDC2891257.1 twin-arginine translocation signal domain-containing protein [Psychrosphaera sp. G1-22]
MFDYTKIKNGPSSSAAEIANVSRRSFLKQLGIGTGAFVLATVMLMGFHQSCMHRQAAVTVPT